MPYVIYQGPGQELPNDRSLRFSVTTIPALSEPHDLAMPPAIDHFGGSILALAFLIGDEQHVIGSAFLIAPGIALTSAEAIEEGFKKGFVQGRDAIRAIGAHSINPLLWEVVSIFSQRGLALLFLDYAGNIEDNFQITWLSCTARAPDVGELLTVYGFFSEEQKLGETSLTLALLGTSDVVSTVWPDGRSNITPHPALSLQARTIPPMIGGPVFDRDGFVVGCLSSASQENDAEFPSSLVALCWDIFTQPVTPNWPRGFWPDQPTTLGSLIRPAELGRIQMLHENSYLYNHGGKATDEWDEPLFERMPSPPRAASNLPNSISSYAYEGQTPTANAFFHKGHPFSDNPAWGRDVLKRLANGERLTEQEILLLEPNFTLSDGPPKLSIGERGLILPSSIYENGTFKSANSSPEEIRFQALFWDKINRTSNSLVGFNLSPDEEFLRTSGILTEATIATSGIATAETLIESTAIAFEFAERTSPGRWSIARESSWNSLLEEDKSGRSLSVKLHRAIPIPAGEVPLADILEFKEHRKAELGALRVYLDEFYQRIILSPDRPLAETQEFDRLNLAISDHMKVIHEAGFKAYLSTLVSNFGVSDLVAPITAGAATIFKGLPMVAAAQAAGAVFTIQAGLSLKDFKRAKSPLEYVTKVHTDLPFLL